MERNDKHPNYTLSSSRLIRISLEQRSLSWKIIQYRELGIMLDVINVITTISDQNLSIALVRDGELSIPSRLDLLLFALRSLTERCLKYLLTVDMYLQKTYILLSLQ